MRSAGLEIERIEIAPSGGWIITPKDATSATTIEARPTDKKNEWDPS
jgi:hypothetical protein